MYRLKLMTASDRDLVLAWRNRPEVRAYMYTSHEISPEEHQRWFETASRDPARRLFICEDETGVPVGVVTFTAIDSSSSSATWGFYTGEGVARGVGSEMGRLALDYAFGDLGLSVLHAEVLGFNSRSLHFHEKLGFRLERVLEAQYVRDGERHDVYQMICAREAWTTRSPAPSAVPASVQSHREGRAVLSNAIAIGERRIGAAERPFVIAEMSGNHNQSLERALEIVDAAAKAGAHAIKLQTYTADTMTLALSEGAFFINDEQSLWKGSSLHDLYKLAHTPWDWHAPIMRRAAERGLLCFSTPFDESAVEFLESLKVPAYKIASFENVHLPLIRKVAATKKPMIISTGMASLTEIDEAVRAARSAGCRDLILLKCTSTYPATPANSNVLTIPHLRASFGCEVGLSDHTMGVGAAVAAVAHGATVIEKHFTLRRLDGGVDSSFSLEPHEMHALVVETERAWQSLGTVSYGPTEAEIKSLTFRRSIYVAEDLKAGEVLTQKNLRCVRPGMGLPPKYYDVLLGRRVNQDVKRGTPMSWSLLG